ncbi:MAG: AAA family ATPase [Planctomycetes bacterium]|nr:AAA family ATPase [Planctomycetota bacterium]MBI3848223.1 AAA family ATPase [Planctomycetota bacterium]
MVTRIEALGFRSLHHVAEDISSFQVLVGPNGSGKSTFLDVVAFLGDMLRVGPLKAILGDSKNGVSSRAVDPSHLTWMRQGSRFELAIELGIPEERMAKLPNGKYRRVRYEVAINVGRDGGDVGLEVETLWLAPIRDPSESSREPQAQRTLFPEPLSAPQTIARERHQKAAPGWRTVVNKIGGAANDYFKSETSDWNNPFRLGPTKSALANLPEDESKFPVATWVKHVLMDGVQRVVLNAEAMRSPSPPGTPRRFLPDGSNLPWVIEGLKTMAPDRFERWVEHVRTALPDLRSVETIERPEDRHRYLVIQYANELKAPSWVVSDGTLRLLALTLLAYLPDVDGLYLIEEPENGIHPRAVETVYQSLSSVYGAQVLCASHSPVILGMARPEDVLCFAKDGTGATDIVRGNKHPKLRDWKGALDLGTLFAAGVLG